MSFSLDISKFVNKCNINADLAVRRVVLDVGASVVNKTPVGDPSFWKSPPPPGYTGGHARANWQHSEGTLVSKEFDVIDKTGEVSKGRIAATLPKKVAGKVHYISNSVPYIQRLEDGWSRQAPNGMVALTVREFQIFIRNALRELP